MVIYCIGYSTMVKEKSHYPEIEELKEVHQKHEVKITVSTKDFLDGNMGYPAVVFSLKANSFHIFVDDEYQDFKNNNPLLSLCLILRELDYYSDSNDYVLWCKEHQLEPNNTQVLSYFRSLAGTYREIEKILGTIDSIINDFDFEMNAGAAFELRKKQGN